MKHSGFRQRTGLGLIVLWTLGLLLSQPTAAQQAPDHPLAPLDTSSPRATLSQFQAAMERAYELASDPATATESDLPLQQSRRTLNQADVPLELRPDQGVESALMLKEILDRIELPPLEAVPDEVPEGGRWRLPYTEIDLVEVTEGERAGEILFSARTVRRIPEFYEKVQHLPYRDRPGVTAGIYEAYLYSPGDNIRLQSGTRLPDWLRQPVFGQTVWQWLAAGVLVGLVAWLMKVVLRLGLRFDNRRAEGGARGVLRSEHSGSIVAAVVVVGLLMVARGILDDVINITGTALMLLLGLILVLVYATLAWLVQQICMALAASLIAGRGLEPTAHSALIIRLVSQVVALVGIALLIMHGLNQLGLPAYSVVTGLGIGGLAVALGAQESIKDLVGSLSLLADKTYAPGDWIIIDGGLEGVVESIGIRSTRIRTFPDSILSVPNAVVAAASVDNMGRRRLRRESATLQIRDDTQPEAIRAFVAGIRDIIERSPATDKTGTHEVHLQGVSDTGFEIMLYFFIDTPDWTSELQARDQIYMDIIRLADRLGVDFAPSQQIELYQGAPSSGEDGD